MTDHQPTSSSFSTSWNDASESDAVYTRVSVNALLALLFGVASFLVFMTPWLFFLGLIGMALGFVALLVIRKSEGSLTGGRVAALGLSLSIISLVAVGTLWPTYHYLVRKEADRFFQLWFQQLAEGNIPLAKGMTSVYWARGIPKDAETWWQEQYKDKYAHRDIHRYMENKLVRVLLALGKDAKVSYYKNLRVETDDGKDTVSSVYAVTYPAAGRTETFFVKMTGQRHLPGGDMPSAGWALLSEPDIFVPEEFKDRE